MTDENEVESVFYLVVCGSRIQSKFVVSARKFVLTVVGQSIQELARSYDRIVVVQGACVDSPDVWARAMSITMGIDYIDFPAKWKEYGKAAGFMRNEEMMSWVSDQVDTQQETNRIVLTKCMAFWDGYSNGTDHAIGMAQKYHIPIQLFDMSSYYE